jgi:hypothetical protein
MVLVFPLAATGVLTSTGCGLFAGCNDAAFASGLAIAVSIPPEPATYRMDVEAEGETLRLTYDVGADQFASCVDGCDAAGGRLVVDRVFSVGDQSQLVAQIRLRGEDIGPAKVTVRVSRADVLLAGATVEPRYETDEPNGRGCGDRVLARVALEVP